jgi:hypothetical protein
MDNDLPIKFYYGSNVKLFRLKDDIGYSDLKNEIKQLYSITPSCDIDIKYIDDGDIIWIDNDNTLNEVIKLSKYYDERLELIIDTPIDFIEIYERFKQNWYKILISPVTKLILSIFFIIIFLLKYILMLCGFNINVVNTLIIINISVDILFLLIEFIK